MAPDARFSTNAAAIAAPSRPPAPIGIPPRVYAFLGNRASRQASINPKEIQMPHHAAFYLSPGSPMFAVFNCLTTQHDWRLVVVAGLVCFVAALTAISLFHRARAALGGVRSTWVVAAGVMVGCGIWATHFIAMLAYEPGVPVAYGVGETALSLLAAMIITAAGLRLAAGSADGWGAPMGGAIVGGGVACT